MSRDPQLQVMHVVGARPNFMKAAPVVRALARHPQVRSSLVHTGQHYDHDMSAVFFKDLELPAPDFYLGVGSGSHAEQTAGVMVAFERTVTEQRPDVVVVYGDVNSTLACALVGAKLNVPVAHVEAGLRSGDRTMPEETNRIVTDAVSAALYVSEPAGMANLAREGRDDGRAVHVGNVMIDTLAASLPKAQARAVPSRFGVRHRGYALVTLHRPSNVDDPRRLADVVQAIAAIGERLPVVFPVHPRTRHRLEDSELAERLAAWRSVCLTGPLSYLDFLALMNEAQVVLTDSGGVQEETTYLRVPCITLRTSTERPITVTMGTNEVVGDNPTHAIEAVERILAGRWKDGAVPPLWDGNAAERIAEHLVSAFAAKTRQL